jgi:hypothetical protein
VLAHAISDLLAAGQRVLLVSPTAGEVDDVLLGALRSRHPGAGVAVRAGAAPRPAVARDHDVSLPRLVARRAAKLTAQRQQVEDDLVRLTAPARELVAIARQLAGFDEAAYHHGVQLAENEKQRETAVESFAAAWFTAHQADEQHKQTETARHESAQRRAALQPAANVLAEAAAAQRELAELHASHERATEAWETALGMLREHDEQAAELATAGPLRRLRTRSTVRVHQQRQSRLQLQLDQAQEELDRSEELVTRRAAELTARISRLREQAAPVDDETVRAADLDHEWATARSTAIGDRLAEANAAADSAAAELKAAEALPGLDAHHQDVLGDARSRGIPRLLARRAELSTTVAASAEQIRDLEQHQEKLGAELDRLRPSLESRIIHTAQLVATTQAHALTHPAVLGGQYDVVLVADACATTVPELVPVVARAARTAVLFGDFRQGGPDLPSRLNPHRPDVKKWLARDVFACCGITSPKAARQHCVVLHQQYRLPPLLTALANDAGYEGTLLASPLGSDADSPIVFVDTDGLGDLAAVRPAEKSAGWWPAGALLAGAIAQRHRDTGESVGVLTSSPQQTEITLDAIRDGEGGTPETAVGAAVRERQFDVVVFDLVAAHQWSPEAERMCAVAATRPRQRLYLLGSATAMHAARKGTLGAVTAMLADGRIRRRPGAEVLADHQHPELVDEIGAAEESLWFWAPWSNQRLATVYDALAAAVARGVRVVAFVPDAHRGLPYGVRAVGHPDSPSELLVIDRRRTLIGAGDGMTAHDGPRFAERLLRHERADTLAAAPGCPQCPATPLLRRYKRDSPLWWVCPGCGWSQAA